jgi:hypothetical protein
MVRWGIFAVVLLVCVAGAVLTTMYVMRQEPPADPYAGDIGRPLTLFDEHLKQAGMTVCRDSFGGLGDDMTQGAAYVARSAWSDDRDLRYIRALADLTFSNEAAATSLSAAGILFAVAGAGECQGMFVRVLPMPTTCETFLAQRPEGAEVHPPLGDLVNMTLPNGWDVALLPAADLCIVVATAQR